MKVFIKRIFKARERNARGNFGGVAQLGEHLPCKQGVDSSILFISTTGESLRLKVKNLRD